MNIKVWGESMAYIENVVIGTPIVDPKDMFVSDEDDWTRMEEEEIMESVSEKERDETEQEDRTNENSFFERTDDSYAIYQYDNTDGNWGYKFMGLSIISNMGLSVDGKDYRMMFMEQLHEHDSLDELYHRFNAERPEGFDGHSLSVSDVVIMKRNGEMKAYYVDDVGFSELPEFTKQREQIIDRSNDSPVYAGTLEQAVRQKDADAYLDSRKLNIDCKKAIEEAIQENYDGIRLKDDVAKDVVRRFGEERMNFVMANTIRESFLEGRFSKQNKEWAEHINIPENISHGRNLNLDYIIESHPVVLDDFISMARFEIRMLKIERAIEDAEVSITTDTNDYVADGHEGAWHTIEESKSPVRSCEDVDEAVLSFAEIKALATGNPYIKEKMELDIEVAKLKVLKANHNANRYRLENQIVHDYPLKISNEKVRIQQLQEDLKCYQSYQIKNQDRFEMIIENVTFDDKELAGKAIRTAAKKENRLGESGEIGTYQGFTMFVSYNHISNSYNLKLQNQRSYLIELGENGLGNIIRINNALDNIPKHIARAKQNLQTYESQLEDAKIEVMKEFPKEADLKEKTDRLSELNALLNMDQSNHEIVAEEQIEEQETAEVTNKTQKNEVVPKFGTR